MNTYALFILIIAFIAVMVFLGFVGYKRTNTLQDYLIAGRKMPYYVMALSYSAAFISTSFIVGFGGVAGIIGMDLLWLTFSCILFGVIISFVFYGKKTRRMGVNLEAYTFPEILGKRFDSKFIQKLSGAVIFISMPIYAAVVLVGSARFIESTLKINFLWSLIIMSIVVLFYVLLGGLKGIMYGDSFLGILMLSGVIILVFLAYNSFGGIVSSHKSLTELKGIVQPLANQLDHHAPVFSKVPPILKEIGHQGWTAMPQFGSNLWWTLLTTMVLGIGIGMLAQPQLIVRFMSVKNDREINRAIPLTSILLFFMITVPLVAGALSNIYFFNKTGEVSVISLGGNGDLIIPAYVRQAFPAWFGYIFMLTVLAAAMSTISSQFHISGTAFSKDIWGIDLFENKTGRSESRIFNGLMLTRFGTVIGFMASVVLGYYLPLNIVARGTVIFFNICTATFLPLYTMGLFWRKTTKAGAVSGMLVGLISSLLWISLVQKAQWYRLSSESTTLIGIKGLLKFPWDSIDSILFALPLSFLVIIIVSRLTKPLPKNLVEQCFKEGIL